MAAYHFALRRAACLLLLIAALCGVSVVNSSAQLVRAGSPRLVDSGDLVFGGDAAYDPVHQVYLVVLAREADISGSVWGAFLDTAGNPTQPPFLIHSGGRANFARVAYSPDASNGAGGQGAFLVTWTEYFTPGVFSKIVAYPGWVDGAPPRLLSAEYNVREIGYSPTAQRFMLAWESYEAPQSAYFQRVALNGVPLAAPIALTTGNAGRPWIIWNSITSIGWHAVRNEFGILYAAQDGSSWMIRFARVTPAGAVLDTRDVAEVGAEPIAAALAFSPLTGNYIALWAEPNAGAITGAELRGTGDVIARGPIPQSIVAGQNGMALAYSGGSGTFLLLGYATLGTGIDQIKGIELNKHGAPNSPVIGVTDFPLTNNYFAPRAAGRSDAPEWLVTAGTFDSYAQIVSTSTLHGGSELRLDGCVGPDPFAALGGGHCVGGGWVPPSSLPPPPPPPPSGQPGGCATPDPFAAMGGGTCYNGGWLPPGMPIPNAPAPGPEPPAPPPPPPPPAGCTTPDPFVAMGGGTCYNGGWLPPGMPVPNAPARGPEPTPTPPPPPAPPSGCTTADPFVAMGGGTCYNGGWLPPGMPVPNQPAPEPGPAPPPPPSDGCTTPDPFAALGGGQCVNGGWLPPGMYFPGNGIIGPNPDPLFPPPPQSTNDCTTPDPFLDTAGLIGVCVNGAWQPVNGAHATGTVFRIDGVWMLREDDTGLVYTPLNGMPSSLHTLGLPVYFEGIVRYDILHTFAAPILQLRTLVLR